jgi:hypothetical protein
MLRKLGLAITYFIAIVYILSILFPSIHCFRHGCRGPEGDAFMPAFLTPIGTIATGFLTVQRHTTDQKKTIMVLGLLASGNYFRDCSARRNRLYRALDLSPYISSLRAGCHHPPSCDRARTLSRWTS